MKRSEGSQSFLLLYCFLAAILFCTSPMSDSDSVKMLSFDELSARLQNDKSVRSFFFLSQSPICSNPIQSSKVGDFIYTFHHIVIRNDLLLFSCHFLSVSAARNSNTATAATRFFSIPFLLLVLNTKTAAEAGGLYHSFCFTISSQPFLETIFVFIFSNGFFLLLLFISHFGDVWPLHDCPQ